MRRLSTFARFTRGIVVLALAAASISNAQTFKLLHIFSNSPDGADPQGVLVRDSAGTLYGTTSAGGVGNCYDGNTYGCGTVFKINGSGKETILYKFTGGTDGANPVTSLIRDAGGNLYGVTPLGGSSGCGYQLGCGVVFKVDSTGHETVLHTFTGYDGAYPQAGLIRDAKGNLYGVTSGGGANALGTVFKLSKAGKETVLYSFRGSPDGEAPLGLSRDTEGNLYGTTYQGGAGTCVFGFGCGTVFKLSTTGKETVLHSFEGGADGEYPYAGPVLDADGNAYGTTASGGDLNCPVSYYGCGTVFEVDKTGREILLHIFAGYPTDGSTPYAGLVLDRKGNLYGTALGDSSGNGVVFKLNEARKETLLYVFRKAKDGAGPMVGLTEDADGNFYGSTVGGGGSSNCGRDGCGVVFKLTPR